MSSQIISPEKRYRMSLLLDAYGDLLTEKQRGFLRSHYEGDFSFGEIAREQNVSRQAIFDAVKHGEATLENYERVLGLLRSRSKDAGKAGIPSGGSIDCELAEIAARLRDLSQSNPAGARFQELESIAERIESIAAGNSTKTAATIEVSKDRREARPVRPASLQLTGSVFGRSAGLEVD